VLHAQGRKGDLLLYSVLRRAGILRRRPAYSLNAIAAWPRTATLLVMTQKMVMTVIAMKEEEAVAKYRR
jgi:hypothetical protein